MLEQIVKTQIKRHRMWRLIWVYTVYNSCSVVLDTSAGNKIDLVKLKDKYINANLRAMGTRSGEVTPSKLFCVPFEKRNTLNENNLLPIGANSFRLEVTPFQKEPGLQ